MKVAHIHQFFVPNLGYQENHLPAKQSELGLEVHLITSDEPPPKFRDSYQFEPGIYEHNGVTVHRLKSSFYSQAISETWMSGLPAKLRSIDPDIVQSRNVLSTQSYRAARYCSQTNTPLFVDDHIDNDNISLDELYKKGLYKLFQKVFFKKISETTHLFLPVQPHSREFLHQEFGIPYERMELLPLGVDSEAFYPNEESGNKIRKEYGIGDQKLFLFAGNIDPRKDLDVLIRAFSEVSPEHNTRLLILGSPSKSCPDEHVKSLKQLASDLGVEEDIMFRDAVDHDELPAYLNAADVGIWPGKLGVTTLEGIGTGLPVIVCDSRATNYMIENDNGLKFTRGDSSVLADCMRRYIEEEKLIQSHAENAIEHVQQSLSWTAIAEKNIELYKAALPNES